MSRALVVTGTDTGIGKTVLASAIAGALGATYWKPIQAGLDGSTDAETVAHLAGSAVRIHPEAWRLKLPASPHFAAEREGVTIDVDTLRLPDVQGPLVVEGAGGVLVPVTRGLLFADLFARWGAPVVIAARTALGTINHSLMTIEALRVRNIAILGIAFIGDPNEDSEATIAAMGGVRRLGRLPRLDPLEPAALARAFAGNFDLADFRR